MSLKDRLRAADAALDQTPQPATPAVQPAQAEGVVHRAPPASQPSVARPFQPRTGPGGLLANMDQLRNKDREIAQLQQKLAEWVDAQPARRIDPALIDLSAYANRHESSYAGADWAEFKSALTATNGNTQPILVRRKEDGRFELVFGHRRTQGCRELGLQVLAVIADNMSDVDLFLAMEAENSCRKDLSPYEQGMHYKRALDAGLFPSYRSLAAALNRDHSIITRYKALVELPPHVLAAFPDRTQIQVRWAPLLADAVQKDPEAVHAAAAELQGAPVTSAAEIFRRLTAASRPAAPAPITIMGMDGAQRAELKVKGKSLEIRLASGAFDRKTLEQIEAALKKILVR